MHGSDRSFRAPRSNVHTSMSRLPTVTNLVLVLLKNLTHFVSPAVGNPQIASPVPTSHTTTELSSCPPRDARYFPSALNDSDCTFTL